MLGMPPDNSLKDKSIEVTTFKFPISWGSGPLKKFENKLSFRRSLRPPMVGDMLEFNSLETRLRYLKAVMFPKHAGTGP